MDCCRENNSSQGLLNAEEGLPSDPVNAPLGKDAGLTEAEIRRITEASVLGDAASSRR